MMRLDLLNRTLERDRDGMSTYGGRPRSANWTTSSARPRIEPSVFLSFTVSVAVSEGFFVFLAIVFFLIDDQYVVAEFLCRLFYFFAAIVELSVGGCGSFFGNVHQSSVQFFP